jgi:hypothetical protein
VEEESPVTSHPVNHYIGNRRKYRRIEAIKMMALDGLLRYQLFSVYACLFLGLWLALRSKEDGNIVVNYAPLWLISAIGVFAVFSITRGVINLADCPEAAKEVNINVKEARVAMQKKGII